MCLHAEFALDFDHFQSQIQALVKLIFPFICLVGSALPFLPTKIHEDKFNNQGIAQGLVTTYKLWVHDGTL